MILGKKINTFINLDDLYERGLFQNIGLKEFRSYLSLATEEKDTDKGQKTLTKAIENMKLVGHEKNISPYLC